MNKADMINKISEVAGLSKSEATKAVEAIIAGIKDSLKSGEEVVLSGLGKFSVSERAERMGRNPQTGESIKIPARKVAKFTAGKDLKDAVN